MTQWTHESDSEVGRLRTVLLEAGAQLVVRNFDDERLWQLIAQMSG